MRELWGWIIFQVHLPRIALLKKFPAARVILGGGWLSRKARVFMANPFAPWTVAFSSVFLWCLLHVGNIYQASGFLSFSCPPKMLTFPPVEAPHMAPKYTFCVITLNYDLPDGVAIKQNGNL